MGRGRAKQLRVERRTGKTTKRGARKDFREQTGSNCILQRVPAPISTYMQICWERVSQLEGIEQLHVTRPRYYNHKRFAPLERQLKASVHSSHHGNASAVWTKGYCSVTPVACGQCETAKRPEHYVLRTHWHFFILKLKF